MDILEPGDLPKGAAARARTSIKRSTNKKRAVFRLEFTEEVGPVEVYLNGEFIYGRG